MASYQDRFVYTEFVKSPTYLVWQKTYNEMLIFLLLFFIQLRNIGKESGILIQYAGSIRQYGITRPQWVMTNAKNTSQMNGWTLLLLWRIGSSDSHNSMKLIENFFTSSSFEVVATESYAIRYILWRLLQTYLIIVCLIEVCMCSEAYVRRKVEDLSFR